ncbi:aminodeoxychorismate lyase [Planctobacterium marinum]|uniref:aminodeoxychorismate lyase n=1 Tax=Planctobacterium marinum TaxID=1631968 RepID=UPI001E4C493A|nr:aminodeoxychorismate lyase [Planctobacterium marinum]MCC2604128.1 aminodeoxychorismate lyase [Planctobacterium marinum]
MHISFDYPFESRAASYGDGCFTTAAIELGEIELLEAHLLRLKSGSQKLRIPVTEQDLDSLRRQVSEAVKSIHCGVVKIIISAGDGGRGYARDTVMQPRCYIKVMEGQPDYSQWQKQGIELSVADNRLSKQPSLAGLKHLNRLEQSLLKLELNAAQDMLVLDTDNKIVEVTAGNVFWKSHNRWFTPDLHFSGVEGVMRNHLIQYLHTNNQQVTHIRASLNALEQATDMLICNSLMRVVAVNCLRLGAEQSIHLSNQNVTRLQVKLNQHLTIKGI